MSAVQTLERPTMTRRPHKPRELLVLDQGSDYGPGHSLSRGRLKSWGGAADVVLEERGDLDNPKAGRTIRGGRRRIALDDLLSRGTITQRHHDAVVEFLKWCSTAGSGSSGEFGMRGGGMPATSLPERQLKAAMKVRLAWDALGRMGRPIFAWTIFDNRSLGDYERHLGLKEGGAGTRLRLTLTMLDEHFNPKARR